MTGFAIAAIRNTSSTDGARCGSRSTTLVPVDLDEPLVADAEVVGNLVKDDASDLPAQQLGIVAVEPPEWAAVDRDLEIGRAHV